MAKNTVQKHSGGSSPDQRRMRRNQIIFSALSVIVILSWIISLIVIR